MAVALIFLIGFLAGLRSMTAPAAVAWGVYLGWLPLQRPLSLIGSLLGVMLLTLGAIAELVVDKLPNTPSRTAPMGLIARIVTGGLSGACVAYAAGQPAVLGGSLGAVGGVAGCFVGFFARKNLVKSLRVADIYIALLEDLVARSEECHRDSRPRAFSIAAHRCSQ